MLFGMLKSNNSTRDQKGQSDAINRSMAVIEFNIDGIILDANDNFVKAIGYSKEQIRGQHHSMFVKPDEANSP
jgi:methyl-accepting chemotaxis protein